MMRYREGRWIPLTTKGKSTRKDVRSLFLADPRKSDSIKNTQLGGTSRQGLQQVARPGTSRAQAALLQLIICAQGQPDIPVDLGLLLILSFNLPRAQVSAVWPSAPEFTSLSLFSDLQYGGSNNLWRLHELMHTQSISQVPGTWHVTCFVSYQSC